MDRQKFIDTILRNKSLTGAQKTRISALIARDSEAKKEKPLMDRVYRDPKQMSDFLIAYNQDPFLKYSCHPIDDQDVIAGIKQACNMEHYDLSAHQRLLLDRFTKLCGQYFNIDYKLRALIRAYLSGTNAKGEKAGWSSLQIEENWASENLIAWSKEHPDMIPCPGENIAEMQENEGYKLQRSFTSNLTGRRILLHTDLVMYFKSLFHIKRDNNLRTILAYINSNGFRYGNHVTEAPSDKADITLGEFDDKEELFTDVDKLIQAYIALVRICVENHQKGDERPHLQIEYFRDKESGRICLTIHHLNSEYQKSIDGAVNRIGERQNALIENQLNGLCDLYVQADFGRGEYWEVNLWDGNPREKKKIQEMRGVKYILKF